MLVKNRVSTCVRTSPHGYFATFSYSMTHTHMHAGIGQEGSLILFSLPPPFSATYRPPPSLPSLFCPSYTPTMTSRGKK